jgi:hypothetical protein
MQSLTARIQNGQRKYKERKEKNSGKYARNTKQGQMSKEM